MRGFSINVHSYEANFNSSALSTGAGIDGGAEAPLVHAVEAAGRRAFQRASPASRQATPARWAARHRPASLRTDAYRDNAARGRAAARGTLLVRRRRARFQRIRDRRPQAEALEEQKQKRLIRVFVCTFRLAFAIDAVPKLMTHS